LRKIKFERIRERERGLNQHEPMQIGCKQESEFGRLIRKRAQELKMIHEETRGKLEGSHQRREDDRWFPER
jgi:hypothetical protein